MHSTTCKNCGVDTTPSDRRVWRWSGWVVYGAAPSAPPRQTKEFDSWDWCFHKKCYGEWIDNRNGFLQDLDRPANNCIYFQRTGTSIHGYYVRDGKKYPCLAAWTESDILKTSICPTVVNSFKVDIDGVDIVITKHEAFIQSFRDFLNKNGWLDRGWYEPRKPFAAKDDVCKQMRESHVD